MVKFFPFWQIWLIIFQTISTNFSFCRTAFLYFLSFLMCFCSGYVKYITVWTALKWRCPLSFTYHFKMGSSLIQFLYFPHSKLWSWSLMSSQTKTFQAFSESAILSKLTMGFFEKDCGRRQFGDPCEHQPYCCFCFQMQKRADGYSKQLTESLFPLCLVGNS